MDLLPASVTPEQETDDGLWFKDAVVYGLPVPASLLAWVTVYAMVYVAALMLVALAVFRSKDFQ